MRDFEHPLLRVATPAAWVARACESPDVLMIDHANCERLRRLVAKAEPHREVDLMICGAFIEARSCERFAALAGAIGAPLRDLFQGLHNAEARHHRVYLDLARRAAKRAGVELQARIEAFASLEAQLITAPDAEFRFHSGPP
jgi:tRNA-(ms[2]io[6]A)-hydroxylase